MIVLDNSLDIRGHVDGVGIAVERVLGLGIEGWVELFSIELLLRLAGIRIGSQLVVVELLTLIWYLEYWWDYLSLFICENQVYAFGPTILAC